MDVDYKYQICVTEDEMEALKELLSRVATGNLERLRDALANGDYITLDVD